MLRPPALAAALSLAAALPLSAQVPAPVGDPDAPVPAGARVRLTSVTVDGVFRVLAATRDTLVVQRDPTAPVQRVAVAAIDRIEVSLGRRSTGAGAWRGFLAGAGIGAAIGLVSGFADGDDPPGGYFSLTAEGKAVGGAILVGLGGGIIGTIAGAGAPGERWQRVEGAPRVSLVAPPAGRGVGVRLAGAF